MAPSQIAKQAQREAERGSAAAQSVLGLLHLQGAEGLQQDDVKAETLLLSAATLGNGDAQLQLALIYYTDTAFEEKNNLAADWMRKAADQGIPTAQFIWASGTRTGSASKRICLWERPIWSSAPRRDTSDPSCS
jgi:TPR repeat protein